ncbi:hypothetical protein AGR5A_pb0074 [Agrobacterium genomosp. 5 str. CFBP 6626]|nr:hypothetical protein AGR5A_pb0074 [Agrobacterium genomosp. 5 str. CFBP 6626]
MAKSVSLGDQRTVITDRKHLSASGQSVDLRVVRDIEAQFHKRYALICWDGIAQERPNARPGPVSSNDDIETFAPSVANQFIANAIGCDINDPAVPTDRSGRQGIQEYAAKHATVDFWSIIAGFIPVKEEGAVGTE